MTATTVLYMRVLGKKGYGAWHAVAPHATDGLQPLCGIGGNWTQDWVGEPDPKQLCGNCQAALERRG